MVFVARYMIIDFACAKVFFLWQIYGWYVSLFLAAIVEKDTEKKVCFPFYGVFLLGNLYVIDINFL